MPTIRMSELREGLASGRISDADVQALKAAGYSVVVDDETAPAAKPAPAPKTPSTPPGALPGKAGEFVEPTVGERIKSDAASFAAGIGEGLGGVIGQVADAATDVMTAGPFRRGVKSVAKTVRGEPLKPEDYLPQSPISDLAVRAADDAQRTFKSALGVRPNAITDVTDAEMRVAGVLATPNPEFGSAGKMGRARARLRGAAAKATEETTPRVAATAESALGEEGARVGGGAEIVPVEPPVKPPEVQPLGKQKQLGSAFPAGVSPDNVPPPKSDRWVGDGTLENPQVLEPGRPAPEVMPERPGYMPNEEGYVSSDFTADFDPKRYVAEQVAKREAARQGPMATLREKAGEFYRDLKTVMVDYAAPIEDALNRAIKQNDLKLKPSEHITNQIDRVLRAPSIAGQFARDIGLERLIQTVGNDLDEFEQVLIARHARDVEATVFEPGEMVGVLNRANGDVETVRLGTKAAREAQAKAHDFFEDLIRRMNRQTGTRMSSAQVSELAEQVARDHGLNLDEIPGARAGVVKLGKNTGRDLVQDEKLLQAVGNKYDRHLAQWREITHKTLDYIADAGLIDKELAEKLKDIYPNYAPLNRIFSAIEEEGHLHFGTRPLASLSRQTVVQKLEGSSRQIESPIRSMMAKIGDAFVQGERNKAARLLYSYKELPGNPFDIGPKHVGDSARNVSFLDNGRKVTFSTTKEVAAAAKALDVQTLGLVGKILSFPTRVARVGITGLNVPFVAANVARDQLTAFINSRHALRTSLANPPVFMKALAEAIGHGKVYDEMLREGALGTSFDMTRNQIPKTIERVRSAASPARFARYVATHPTEWLRMAEDVLGRGEEMTRIQQYLGAKQKALLEGLPEQEARIYAARASRETTVNFARRGSWGKVLNSAFLYMNANIQGVRQLGRVLMRDPVGTAGKIVVAVFLPTVITTAWNMGDERRRYAYEDIPDWEKENNLIIVPDAPTKDENGRWRVIKIPLAQGVNNLSVPIRTGVEKWMGSGRTHLAADLFTALFGTASPISPSIGAARSTLTPQILKPTLEATIDKNLFTGGNISSKAALRRTSATAKEIGQALGIDPTRVEFWLRETFGGVASQALNASDRAQAAAGIIEKHQVGGESISEGAVRRFFRAYGGEHARRAEGK